MHSFTGLYKDLESELIREREKISECSQRIDRIEGYKLVDREDLAELYEHGQEDFERAYLGNLLREENEIPAINSEEMIYQFVVDEDQDIEEIVENGAYEAALGEGAVEVRDPELWRNEVFQQMLSEWSEWRDNQKLFGMLEVEDLKVHRSF